MPATPAMPRHLQLGPHQYTIESDDHTGVLLHDEGSRGDSRPDQLIIRVDTRRPHTVVAETLLHEAIHCAWHQTSLSANHDNDAEEAVVMALAPRLLELMHRNPKLLAYLLATP